MSGTLDITRITKLIVLLSSDKEGEVLAAVRAIDKTLKNSKLTWHDLAERLSKGSLEKKKNAYTAPPREPKPQEKRCHTSEERFTFLFNSKLTAWETEFVRSVHQQWRRRGTVSERQSDVLRDIFERVKSRRSY